MYFESLDHLLRILLVGIPAYIGLVFLLRISGNRTLSKMNSFDLVITIAFGSILSSILVSKSVSLAQGLTAIALLVLWQFIITWLSVRFKTISSIVKTAPTLVVRDGEYLHEAMKSVRITEDEIRSALRKQGMGSISQAAAIVLDTDGSLSVISTERRGSMDALKGVTGC